MSELQKNKGQYFTPLNIVKAIVKLTLEYVDKRISPYRVLDPATGEGIFIQEVIKLYSKENDLIHVDALDIDPIVLEKARLRLLPLIDRKKSVKFSHKNFLTENFQGDKNGIFDLVIGNPPHNAKYGVDEWDIIQSMDQEYVRGKIPSESALFFVLKSLLLLKEGGILSFILPKPFCYSNRWKSFRELCLSTFCLLAVFDLANQFSGQLQEQVVIILRKSPPRDDFLTGVWNSSNGAVQSFSRIQTTIAHQADNFLVSITPNEHKLIEKLYSKCEPIEWNAFRGLSSTYRTQNIGIPLIEKITIAHGFLLPFRSYIEHDTPERLVKRLMQPKIICQRIISYSTQPTFRLFLPSFIDEIGEYLTHETVINISPSLIPGINIYSYGALLQSELIRWWLQHVVYTRNFVTSKDLDNPYLKKLLLPKFKHKISREFRRRLTKNLAMMTNNDLIDELRNQSKIEQFFAIGELYKLYQREGILIKNSLCEIQENFLPKSTLRLDTDFKRVKRLNFLFTRNRIEEVKKILVTSSLAEKRIKSLVSHYSKKLEIQFVIDEIIYLMYDLSIKEQEIISGGRKF
ncbi:MAG: N-6 DNA methylase [Candidatus Heimdallarchaeota archaeon]|nr:N-6 DNA methylase [Candidatus Heimdallarchaeota archaeon]